MRRDALVRCLRRYATKRNLLFELDKSGGKGSHYRIRLGVAVTTLQSGELTPYLVNRICKQLGIDPADLGKDSLRVERLEI